jgi:outer membrane immunogenic protein
MKKVMVGVTVALALVTSNAAADGVDRRPAPAIAAPQPVFAPTWSGFYIGAGIGAGAVVHEVSAEINPPVGPSSTPFSFDGIGGEGVLGTVIVGWDWQVGTSTVFGIFADYDFSDISTRFDSVTNFNRSRHDHNNAWSVGARLGWLSNPSTLWYLTGGYTEAEFDSSISFPVWAEDRSGDRTFQGWFAGAGLDTRLAASNWFLRLEYRFSQFDSETVFESDGTAICPAGVCTIDVEPSVHTARLTLTYKFGGTGYGWSGWNGWGR